MHFDSFSLGARHLFQKLVLFFFMWSYTCDTLLFLELKSQLELLKKVCNPIWKKMFWQFSLEALGVICEFIKSFCSLLTTIWFGV
jgi:hypothetical protein